MRSQCSSRAKHIGLTLATHWNRAGDPCFPSIKTLAEESSSSTRTVQYGLRELEREKWLHVEQVGLRYRKWDMRQYLPRFPESLIELEDVASRGATIAPLGVQLLHPSRRTAQSNELSPNPISGEMGDWFEKFIQEYPNKSGKARAWRTVKRLNPDAAKREKILEGLRRWCAFNDPKKAPLPSSWLRGERWLEALDRSVPWVCKTCGSQASVGDGRDYWCRKHDPAVADPFRFSSAESGAAPKTAANS